MIITRRLCHTAVLGTIVLAKASYHRVEARETDAKAMGALLKSIAVKNDDKKKTLNGSLPPGPRATDNCVDNPIGWHAGWHPVRGAILDCNFFEEWSFCESFGDVLFETAGFTANEACCACGGGITETGTVPENNDCENAEPVSENFALGTTLGASIDDDTGVCDVDVSAPGVWYTVRGTGQRITADTCSDSTNFDTKITVYQGSSCSRLSCVEGNDDYCDLQSSVTWESTVDQEYKILVHGFGSAAGDFRLDITPEVEPPNVCEQQYGGETALFCEETSSSCTFYTALNGKSCDDYCEEHGGTCIAAQADANDGCEVDLSITRTCQQTAANDDICTCTRGSNQTSLVYGLQPSCNTIDTSGFNLCLDLKSVSGRYESWMDAFGKSKERWEKVITGNLPSVPSNSLPGYDEYICNNYPSSIDDVYICAEDADIDGESGILGGAMPIWAQTTERTNPKTGEPYLVAVTGVMIFDRPDIPNMMSQGTWEEVVQHETLHALGFGSLWDENGLYTAGSGVYASGTNAEREWNDIGCDGLLPVELDGGQGTEGSHWDEDCLGHEMMTGYLSGVDQPLSRITIGSLEDIGYDVDYSQADTFSKNDLNLNYCGTSCRGTNQLRHLVSKGVLKKPLSPAGHAAVVDFAKKEFMSLQKEPEEHPEQFVYIGGRSIDVMYEEDGEVYVVTITRDAV